MSSQVEALPQSIQLQASAAGRPVNRLPPSTADWEAVKSIVHRLYVEQEFPLRGIKTYLEERHGFRASERMFKARLQKWSFSKNLTKEDWEALAVLLSRRKKLGKRSTCFFVKDRKKTLRDLQKYSRSQGLTEDLLAANAAADIEIPDYLRAATPESEDTSAVNELVSDGSCKPSPSPDRSSIDKVDAAAANIPGIEHRNRKPPYSLGSTSVWSPQSSHPSPPDWQHHTAGITPKKSLYSSPISSGAASLALTSSTMATSVASEDLVACQSAEPAFSWSFDTNPLHTRFNTLSADSWSSDGISLPSSCDNLSREVELISHQVINPAPLRSRYGAEDIELWMLLDRPGEGHSSEDFTCTCSVCHQPSAAHFISIHTTAPEQPIRNILNDTNDGAWQLPHSAKDEGAWKWIALCFASCINLRKENHEYYTQSLHDAALEFEKLVKKRDPMLLTAAGQIITILHQHNQGSIVTTIMKAAKAVTDRLLEEDDPIRVTVDYLTATADPTSSDLPESSITSQTLRLTYERLRSDPENGAQHPYTIAAYYNYSWLLRNEGGVVEAESNLAEVYTLSCSIFGKHHMQSITALAAMTGAQHRQAKYAEAISNFKIVIRDCKPTLGKNHPYRLEAKRRLALVYKKLGRTDKMAPLHWDVLTGRVRMLGSNHPYTLGQRREYEEVLKALGTYNDAAREEVDLLFENKRQSEEKATRRRRSGSTSSNESACLAF